MSTINFADHQTVDGFLAEVKSSWEKGFTFLWLYNGEQLIGAIVPPDSPYLKPYLEELKRDRQHGGNG